MKTPTRYFLPKKHIYARKKKQFFSNVYYKLPKSYHNILKLIPNKINMPSDSYFDEESCYITPVSRKSVYCIPTHIKKKP